MANVIQIDNLPLSDEERMKLAACKDEAELKAAAIDIIAAHYDLRHIAWGMDMERLRHNVADKRWRANITLVPKEAK